MTEMASGQVAISPTTSEDSRSTVTDASPSPTSISRHIPSSSSDNIKTGHQYQHGVTKSLARTPPGFPEEDCNNTSVWSCTERSRKMMSQTRASAYRSASGRSRTGFGAFRVPKKAKQYVRAHLESERKESDYQAVPSKQQLSKKIAI